MQDQFSRTELLVGDEGLERLKGASVAVFGVGGVGSFAVEALARSGVGRFLLVDDDLVCLTNLNRQLHAVHDTVGQPKTKVMAQRVLAINPQARVETREAFCLPDNVSALLEGGWDYVIDAVDTVTAKLCLVEEAERRGIPIISCMGAGNKMDPTAFRVADIYQTSMCPLCRVMRRELKKRGVKGLKVVYSEEPPIQVGDAGLTACRQGCVCSPDSARHCTAKHQVPGSMAFVPSVAGLCAAGEVVRDLIGWPGR